MTGDPDALARRLDEGWRMIGEARDANDFAQEDRLMTHWLVLLGEYQATCDVRHWLIQDHHRYWWTKPDPPRRTA